MSIASDATPLLVIALPARVLHQTRQKAIEHASSLRCIVLKALIHHGLHIKPSDFESQPDRLRPIGQRTASVANPQLGISLPAYVLIQLKALAVRRRVTQRQLILEALAADGIIVEQQHLAGDRRRHREPGTRSHYAETVAHLVQIKGGDTPTRK